MKVADTLRHRLVVGSALNRVGGVPFCGIVDSQKPFFDHMSFQPGERESLVKRIEELQAVRDELVLANDRLVSSHNDVRALVARKGDAGTPPPDAADSKSRFMRFVGEVTEKKDWKVEAEALRERVDALTLVADASLEASQLNVRLLQESNRSLSLRLQSAAADGSIAGQAVQAAAVHVVRPADAIPGRGEAEAGRRLERLQVERAAVQQLP